MVRFRNSSQLFLAPTALGPHQHGRGGQGERNATLGGEGDVAGAPPELDTDKGLEGHGPVDLGQPDPPALHGGLAGHLAQALELTALMAGAPAGDAAVGDHDHDPVGAGLGQLLNGPFGVLALGEGEADGEQWLRWRFPGRARSAATRAPPSPLAQP